ncbi:MAG TPA: tol-pal system protein YbgF [Kofleriaceae bacterium]|nr:tol-pal system protein YbgF [Kofleriaceae bacterium]
MLREDNRRLNRTVTDLRTDRRAQDRKLRDLQHQVDELRAQTPSDGTGAIPVLPVEVAGPASALPPGPDAPRVVGTTEDGVEIVYEGDAIARPVAAVAPDEDTPRPRRAPALALRPAASAPSHASSSAAPAPPIDVPVVSDRLEVTRHVPPVSAMSARAPVRSKSRDNGSDRGGDAASDYRAAVELVKGGKHDEAVAALRAFIARYPRHDYADNAQYWLGEAFYAEKDYARALVEFRRVIEVYPRGNKVPDALLKVGYCYQSLHQTEKARAVLEQVVNLYPKSEPATLAAKRLETP